MLCDEYTSEMVIRYVADDQKLDGVIRDLSGCEEIGLDFETSGFCAHIDVPWLLSLRKRGSDTVYVIDVQRCDVRRLKETIERCVLIGADIKFDLKFLRKLGIRPRQVWCVITIGRLLTAGKKMPNDLSSLSGRNLGFPLDKSVRSRFAMHPSIVKRLKEPPRWSDKEIRYAATDAYVLHDIKDAQAMMIEREDLWKVAILENRLVPVSADMEYAGIYVDRDEWMKLVAEAEREMLLKYGEVCDMLANENTPTTLFADLSGSKYSLNLESTKVVKDCFTRLGVNLESTDERALKLVKHPAAKTLLGYRKLQKQVSTYGKAWINLQNPATGRIHSSFNQLGAASGRYSSNDPNTQNVPDSAYRKCFKARPGYRFCTADFSQIELRIIAELSGDATMQSIIARGGDLHSQTASVLFNMPLDQCGKDSKVRKQGKTMNFALIYGLGDQSLAEALGVSLGEARHLKERYFNTFSGVKAWLADAQNHPFSRGYSVTMLGRKRWYTLPNRDKLPVDDVRRQESLLRNQGKNQPIQGTSSDITKLAMVMIADALLDRGLDAELVNTVHDELIVEFREDLEAEIVPLQRSLMVKAGEYLLKTVPVEVDVTVADYWVK